MNQQVINYSYVESTTAHLMQAIDNALCTLLGQDARTIIYHHIERKFLLKKNEIPFRLDTLSKALFALLGQEPSNMIEKEIGKEFCRRTGIKFDPKANLTVVAYAAYVKKNEEWRDRNRFEKPALFPLPLERKPYVLDSAV